MPAREGRAKILATIGPASRSPEHLAALMSGGVDAFRLNMSHGEQAEHARVIADARRIASEMKRPLALLVDLQGPKIRVGSLPDGPVTLVDGADFSITTDAVRGDAREVSTGYAALPGDVRPGDTILLDDGLLELRVLETSGTRVRTRVVHGGILKEHKGINLPGVAVSAPALTPKDLEDLDFALAQGVEYVALSFVRDPADVARVRERVDAAGGALKIVAKLEKPEAIAALDDILRLSDGVMIARGDLGVEVPLPSVPLLQKRIIREANRLGVLVITATQMLESMIQHPRPTRAEVSDVANAVLDGTDVVMLSGETAVGAFPVETVTMMERIIREAETGCAIAGTADAMLSPAHALARAAAGLAASTAARAIVVFTTTGLSARLVAKERPDVPILAFTERETVYRELALWWGVQPILCRFETSTEAQIAVLERALLDGGYVASGERVVIMGSLPVLAQARTNFLKVHQLVP